MLMLIYGRLTRVFKHSHASVMYNVIHQNPGLQALVQVGVRDYCEEEYRRIQKAQKTFTLFLIPQ